MSSRPAIGLAAAALLAGCQSDEGVPTTPLPPRESAAAERWSLVFDDEFDGADIDPSRWVVREGDMQHPSTPSGATRAMVTVKDGSLQIAAGVAANPGKFPYDCGFVDTKGTFAQTFGRAEIRMRGAYAPGLWYAIWARPWVSAVPELDIELLAANVNQAWLVNHWALPPLPADQRRSFVTVNGFDLTVVHTYVITVLPDLVEWAIDDAPYMRATGAGAPREPLYWVLNSWVGGWAGVPVSNRLPNHFEVESFRVYRPDPWTIAPSIRVETTRGGLDISVADFDSDVTVEVREGDAVLALLDRPPFRFVPSGLSGSAHEYALSAASRGRTAAVTVHAILGSGGVTAVTAPSP